MYRALWTDMLLLMVLELYKVTEIMVKQALHIINNRAFIVYKTIVEQGKDCFFGGLR